MSRKEKILIVEPAAIVIEGLMRILKEFSEFEIHGYAPELVHWDDELRNSINATITQYGFAGQSRYSGETGGWVVMSSHDDAGVELEVATKAEIQLAIKARGDKDACS